ncbi:MAG: CHAT domain-containing protein [Bacteroidota bacterium]
MPTLQTLIMQDKLKPVLEFLATKADSYDNNSIIMLQARLNRLSNNLAQGIIGGQDASLEQNRIRLGISNLAEQMGLLQAELSTEKPSNKTSSTPSSSKNQKQLLFLCSIPKSAELLDFGREFSNINNMRQLGDQRDAYAEPKIQTNVLSDQFIHILARYNPAILHISLHSSKRRGLYFEGLNSEPDPIDVDEFKRYVELYQTRMAKDNPMEIVILSACNSLPHAEAIQSLVPHVVGMNDFMPDEAAVYYARTFYNGLFNGYDYQLAHDIAITQLQSKDFKALDNGKAIHDIPQFLS